MCDAEFVCLCLRKKVCLWISIYMCSCLCVRGGNLHVHCLSVSATLCLGVCFYVWEQEYTMLTANATVSISLFVYKSTFLWVCDPVYVSVCALGWVLLSVSICMRAYVSVRATMCIYLFDYSSKCAWMCYLVSMYLGVNISRSVS